MLRKTALLLIFLSAAVPAQAGPYDQNYYPSYDQAGYAGQTSRPRQQLYLALRGGGVLTEDTTSDVVAGVTGSPPSPVTSSLTTGYGVGGFGAAAMGYRLRDFRRGLSTRLEGEISYMRSGVDNVNGVAASGSANAASVLANGYLDFTRFRFPVVPYVGVGIGGSYVTLDNQNIGGIFQYANDSALGITVQGSLGVSFPFRKRYMFEVGYRYMETFGLDFTSPTVSGFSTQSSTDYVNHIFLVGLRMGF